MCRTRSRVSSVVMCRTGGRVLCGSVSYTRSVGDNTQCWNDALLCAESESFLIGWQKRLFSTRKKFRQHWSLALSHRNESLGWNTLSCNRVKVLSSNDGLTKSPTFMMFLFSDSARNVSISARPTYTSDITSLPTDYRPMDTYISSIIRKLAEKRIHAGLYSPWNQHS